MSNIKATCPTCGEVSLTSADIGLHIEPSSQEGSYRFECPSCDFVVERPADARIIQLLISGGVTPEPLLAPDLKSVHPAFTYDDLLDFHLELEDDRAIAAFFSKSHS